ncbi:FAD-binding oxidoreductase [Hugenholtzia roseola]|uniref:FAD-binding oxidoreductase n=1 Tax=Hugenholtzia roseola TaxID=1002 RepID=UPI00041CFB8E|nr:FAD-binding oxidoreductase [Hugenholtzia roseola]
MNRFFASTEWLKPLRAVLDQNIILPHQEAYVATFPHPTQIVAVLHPTSSEQLSAALKILNLYKLPFYVVSGGKNIGLGSALPPVEDSILIDLSKMNKILHLDEEMAYITLEAGVTFEQVATYLEKQGSNLMMDSIGSTGKASVIGNAAERGHGMGMYADRFQNVCGFEVVLPTGEIIQTGFAAYGRDCKLAPLAKSGVGASLDGLFTQSNLGIITKLSFWLKPKNDFLQTFLFEIDSDLHLATLTDLWRNLRLKGLQASLRIFSDTRLIAIHTQITSEQAWTETLRKELRQKVGIDSKWVGFGGIYSLSEAHAQADRQILTEKLTLLTKKLRFFDAQSLQNATTEAEKQAALFFYENSVLRGLVSDKPLDMCYWRKADREQTQEARADLYQAIHKDKCGVIWYCPIIPQKGTDLLKCIDLVENISQKYQLEINIGFFFIAERAIDITGAICYDRLQAGADQRALRCQDEILQNLIAQGYAPYRLGVQSMSLIKHLDLDTQLFLRRLKNQLDPFGLYAEGRYIL